MFQLGYRVTYYGIILCIWYEMFPVHCMVSYGEYGVIDPLFLNFGSRWRRMVNWAPHFTPGKETWFTL